MTESKTELLAWLNDLLQFSYTRIEQCGSGAAFCQIMDSIYGDVALSKVKFTSKNEYDYFNNFKILQTVFNAHDIDKNIPVDRLVKCRYNDNLEFLQWIKKYWDAFYPGGGYNAVARRGLKVQAKLAAEQAPAAGAESPQKATSPARPKSARAMPTLSNQPSTPSSRAPSRPETPRRRATVANISAKQGQDVHVMSSGAAGSEASRPSEAARKSAGSASNLGRKSVSALSRSISQDMGRLEKDAAVAAEQERKVKELTKQAADLRCVSDTLERERNFYYLKLRDIEVLVLKRLEEQRENEAMPVLAEIQSILYRIEDGFVSPKGATVGITERSNADKQQNQKDAPSRIKGSLGSSLAEPTPVNLPATASQPSRPSTATAISPEPRQGEAASTPARSASPTTSDAPVEPQLSKESPRQSVPNSAAVSISGRASLAAAATLDTTTSVHSTPAADQAAKGSTATAASAVATPASLIRGSSSSLRRLQSAPSSKATAESNLPVRPASASPASSSAAAVAFATRSAKETAGSDSPFTARRASSATAGLAAPHLLASVVAAATGDATEDGSEGAASGAKSLPRLLADEEAPAAMTLVDANAPTMGASMPLLARADSRTRKSASAGGSHRTSALGSVAALRDDHDDETVTASNPSVDDLKDGADAGSSASPTKNQLAALPPLPAAQVDEA
ncbi:hypothetical protein HK405_010972 [Cladochytrium tenue]|nr:hypothetical protein HK405_010972 [Cladochytrium tenue]